MTTYLRHDSPEAKAATTAADTDCQLARQVKGLAAAFVSRPWSQQSAPALRARLPFTREDLWQLRLELPRDFYSRDLLAQAERVAQSLYGAAGARETNRQR